MNQHIYFILDRMFCCYLIDLLYMYDGDVGLIGQHIVSAAVTTDNRQHTTDRTIVNQ
jgi:hypothetical protein